MNTQPEIQNIDPPLALPGGEVIINCTGLDTTDPTQCWVWFGPTHAPIVALSPNRVLAVVPEQKQAGTHEVKIQSQGLLSNGVNVTVGRRLAEDLHPVTNPAFDPDDGAIFVTRSGSRGERLPITLFRIDG